jgi:hypothetical protein
LLAGLPQMVLFIQLSAPPQKILFMEHGAFARAAAPVIDALTPAAVTGL